MLCFWQKNMWNIQDLSPVFTVSDYSESDYSHIYGRLPYGRPFPAPANGRSSGQQRQVYVSEWEWPVIMETPLTNNRYWTKTSWKSYQILGQIKFWYYSVTHIECANGEKYDFCCKKISILNQITRLACNFEMLW